MADIRGPRVSGQADSGRQFASHMMTYTAGEESSRLAAVAKELGLEASRRPRQQVRRPKLQGPRNRHLWLSLLLESATEEAHMKSIFCMHEPQNDQSWPVSPGFFEVVPTSGLKGDHEWDEVVGSGGTMAAAVLGTIKGMVGPAILYLPHGFANAGYMVALPLLSICTITFLYSSRCLLISWRHVHNTLQQQSETTRLLSGADPKRIFLSYPELAYRGLGPHGEALVKAGIALMQFGVCLTYLIFVPQNLQASFLYLFDWNVPARCWLVAMVMFEIPLSWLRDIRKLTPTNLIANVLIAYGLMTCLGFALLETAQGDGSSMENVARHVEVLVPYRSTWYLFFGTSVLLFEGSITLLIPLQEAVHLKACRERFPVVFERVVLMIILFYTIFGLCCWTAFGSDVQIVLTKSLPANSLLASTVQLTYSLAVVLTFPLQNFPALEITTRAIHAALGADGPGRVLRHRSVASGALILALAAVAAAAMEALDRVVSLTGALLGCPIAFVLPPIIYANLVPDLSPGQVWANHAVVALGLLATVGASLVTLRSW